MAQDFRSIRNRRNAFVMRKAILVLCNLIRFPKHQKSLNCPLIPRRLFLTGEKSPPSDASIGDGYGAKNKPLGYVGKHFRVRGSQAEFGSSHNCHLQCGKIKVERFLYVIAARRASRMRTAEASHWRLINVKRCRPQTLISLIEVKELGTTRTHESVRF